MGAADVAGGLLADPSHLARYDAMCRAIAEACGVDGIKQIRDQAQALRLWRYPTTGKGAVMPLNQAAACCRLFLFPAATRNNLLGSSVTS